MITWHLQLNITKATFPLFPCRPSSPVVASLGEWPAASSPKPETWGSFSSPPFPSSYHNILLILYHKYVAIHPHLSFVPYFQAPSISHRSLCLIPLTTLPASSLSPWNPLSNTSGNHSDVGWIWNHTLHEKPIMRYLLCLPDSWIWKWIPEASRVGESAQGIRTRLPWGVGVVPPGKSRLVRWVVGLPERWRPPMDTHWMVLVVVGTTASLCCRLPWRSRGCLSVGPWASVEQRGPGEGRPDGTMRGAVRTVGRGWQQLGRINAFSLPVFACVAIPAQMKEIQIVIDSSWEESVGIWSGSITAAPSPSQARSQPRFLAPHALLRPWPVPTPCLGTYPVFRLEQPHPQ